MGVTSNGIAELHCHFKAIFGGTPKTNPKKNTDVLGIYFRMLLNNLYFHPQKQRQKVRETVTKTSSIDATRSTVGNIWPN